MKELINPKEAPAPLGPYSKAVKVNGFVFVGGQLPLDIKTDEIVAGDIKIQAQKSLENIKTILDAAGSSVDKVVMATVYLKDVGHQKDVNEVWKAFFKKDFPARATVQVARLPKDALIEIAVIAEV